MTNETFDCLACGSKEVDCRMVRYFAIPGMIIVPNSYLLCDEHKDVQYHYDDLYHEDGKRKVIDHEAVINRSKVSE